uniref:Uncharacterized protein n=1 Tax=Pyxicephalus adspersus TaxID=30357 RepID=A0AAV3BBS8_PYXAD|nr:TPA: hypothetical protein GDO54_001742 [Pyxicephalus adspersus]
MLGYVPDTHTHFVFTNPTASGKFLVYFGLMQYHIQTFNRNTNACVVPAAYDIMLVSFTFYKPIMFKQAWPGYIFASMYPYSKQALPGNHFRVLYEEDQH